MVNNTSEGKLENSSSSSSSSSSSKDRRGFVQEKIDAKLPNLFQISWIWAEDEDQEVASDTTAGRGAHYAEKLARDSAAAMHAVCAPGSNRDHGESSATNSSSCRYVLCSMFFLPFLVCDVSLSLSYPSVAPCLHSPTPHDV